MTSYAYQQRATSQRRYDYSDADEDYRTGFRPRGNSAYSDRGRVFGDRPWMRDGLVPTAAPRYVPSYSSNGAAAADPRMAYNQARQQGDNYSRSRSRFRSPSRGRNYDYQHSERDSESSRSSRHRERSESRNRFERAEEQAREALEKTFDTRGKGVGAGLVGALLGAAIGRRVGDRHDNHALAGAIIGGLGVNALENQIHRSREKRREEEEWEAARSTHGGWRRGRSLVREGSRGRSV
ncbi:hypothetical protein ANO11243_024830 [Dothideomycetidae sp. 11243]|nr:hypothetical protein ANO11243_024830 [fungal sp. No.11243]